MIDKMILSKDKTTMTLIYDNKKAFNLHADSFEALMILVDEFLLPLGTPSHFETLSQYETAKLNDLENTVAA